MRNIDPHQTIPETESKNADYWRGYRDGVKERRDGPRSTTADGLLGALLAIALIGGIGYFGYHYATTGRLFPTEIEYHNPFNFSLPKSE